MPVDSVEKRMAVGHIKRPGKGVGPGSPGTLLGRGAIAWNYVTAEPPPPVAGAGPTSFGLGEKKSFSAANELGGGGW